MSAVASGDDAGSRRSGFEFSALDVLTPFAISGAFEDDGAGSGVGGWGLEESVFLPGTSLPFFEDFLFVSEDEEDKDWGSGRDCCAGTADAISSQRGRGERNGER